MRETPIDHKLELYNAVRQEYEITRRKCDYLSRWLVQMTGEIIYIRDEAKQIEGQLQMGCDV